MPTAIAKEKREKLILPLTENQCWSNDFSKHSSMSMLFLMSLWKNFKKLKEVCLNTLACFTWLLMNYTSDFVNGVLLCSDRYWKIKIKRKDQSKTKRTISKTEYKRQLPTTNPQMYTLATPSWYNHSKTTWDNSEDDHLSYKDSISIEYPISSMQQNTKCSHKQIFQFFKYYFHWNNNVNKSLIWKAFYRSR